MSSKVVFVAMLVVYFSPNIASGLPLFDHLLYGVGKDSSKLASRNKTLPYVAEDLGITEVVDWAKKAGVAGVLSGPGPLTFMAPTNKGCDSVPAGLKRCLMANRTLLAFVLKYHVIASKLPISRIRTNNQMIPTLNGKKIRMNVYKKGKVITASGSPIISPDHYASNGVLHEVSRVMLPPGGSVMYAVSKCPKFTTLYSLVTKAGLAVKLSGGTITIFAPTNEAFKKLPKEVMDKLMKDPKMLKAVLINHVIPDAYYSAGLSDNDHLTTLGGKTLTVHMKNGDVYIRESKVVYPDATVTNGVMHAIDTVMVDM